MPAAHLPICKIHEKVAGLGGSIGHFARTIPVCSTIDDFLPNKGLPLGCVHAVEAESLALSVAFASLLSARIFQTARGAVVYIAPDRSLYPLGLLSYGVNPEDWIHISARRAHDLAWAVLEAMRCPDISAVIAVIKSADLTFCRRLQLAAEASGATGFLLGHAASAITKWEISPLKAPRQTGFNGAFWGIELVYARGGRPGKWNVAYQAGALTVDPPQWTAALAG